MTLKFDRIPRNLFGSHLNTQPPWGYPSKRTLSSMELRDRVHCAWCDTWSRFRLSKCVSCWLQKVGRRVNTLSVINFMKRVEHLVVMNFMNALKYPLVLIKSTRWFEYSKVKKARAMGENVTLKLWCTLKPVNLKEMYVHRVILSQNTCLFAAEWKKASARGEKMSL